MHHTVRPHLYLDTNILLDDIFDRPIGSHSRVLLEHIQRQGWMCSTSTFAFAEALDVIQKQKHRASGHRGRLRYRELNRIYDNLYTAFETTYSFVRLEYPTEREFWDDVEILTGITNLRTKDSIHLATAIGASCDLIVTRDNPFIRVAREELRNPFRIPVVQPQAVQTTLQGLGFVVDDHGQATRGAASE